MVPRPRLAAAARALGLGRRRCAGCGSPVPAPELEAGPGVCAACAARLQPWRGEGCPSCGRVYEPGTAARGTCGDCRSRPRPWARLAFHADYEDLLRDMLLGFKFSGRLWLGGLLGNLLVQAYDRSLAAEPPDVVAPVALHGGRLAARGYNQSLELARVLCAGRGLALEPLALERIRATRPQAGLDSREERHRNIKGAFRADPARVRGARVLLVDDIMTTGFTLEEAAAAALKAGAWSVDALVLARRAEP